MILIHPMHSFIHWNNHYPLDGSIGFVSSNIQWLWILCQIDVIYQTPGVLISDETLFRVFDTACKSINPFTHEGFPIDE